MNTIGSIWGAAFLVSATILATTRSRPSASAAAWTGESMTIVDSDGKRRAFFGLEASGQPPRFKMFDSEGRERFQVCLEPENGSPTIILSDENGKAGLILSHNSPVMHTKGGSSPGDAMILIGKNGQGLLHLSTGMVNGKACGTIELLDSDNRQLFMQPAGR